MSTVVLLDSLVAKSSGPAVHHFPMLDLDGEEIQSGEYRITSLSLSLPQLDTSIQRNMVLGWSVGGSEYHLPVPLARYTWKDLSNYLSSRMSAITGAQAVVQISATGSVIAFLRPLTIQGVEEAENEEGVTKTVFHSPAHGLADGDPVNMGTTNYAVQVVDGDHFAVSGEVKPSGPVSAYLPSQIANTPFSQQLGYQFQDDSEMSEEKRSHVSTAVPTIRGYQTSVKVLLNGQIVALVNARSPNLNLLTDQTIIDLSENDSFTLQLQYPDDTLVTLDSLDYFITLNLFPHRSRVAVCSESDSE